MGTGELVVATFNIRNGLAFDGRHAWPCRRWVTAATIRELGADVIGLQEVYGFQLRYLTRSLPGYDWRGRGRSRRGGGEQCPVFVDRARLDVIDAGTWWYGDRQDEPGGRMPGAGHPRIATWARLLDERGEFDVINTHLDERQGEHRARSVQQLAAWVRPGVPTVVLGDFNVTMRHAGVFSPLREVGLRAAEPLGDIGTSHRFTGRTDGPRLDHIFVSPEWHVVDVRVVVRPGRLLPSDHWPVVGTLRRGVG